MLTNYYARKKTFYEFFQIRRSCAESLQICTALIQPRVPALHTVFTPPSGATAIQSVAQPIQSSTDERKLFSVDETVSDSKPIVSNSVVDAPPVDSRTAAPVAETKEKEEIKVVHETSMDDDSSGSDSESESEVEMKPPSSETQKRKHETLTVAKQSANSDEDQPTSRLEPIPTMHKVRKVTEEAERERGPKTDDTKKVDEDGKEKMTVEAKETSEDVEAMLMSFNDVGPDSE